MRKTVESPGKTSLQLSQDFNEFNKKNNFIPTPTSSFIQKWTEKLCMQKKASFDKVDENQAPRLGQKIYFKEC